MHGQLGVSDTSITAWDMFVCCWRYWRIQKIPQGQHIWTSANWTWQNWLDELLVDMFYSLDKSSKWKQSLEYFQLLNGKETKNVMKHVSTQYVTQSSDIKAAWAVWASHRFLQMRAGAGNLGTQFKVYCTHQAKVSTWFHICSNKLKWLKSSKTWLTVRLKPVNKVEKVHQLMTNPYVKLYTLLSVFDITNQALQKNESVTDQLKDQLMHFVLPKVIYENANVLHKMPFAEHVYKVEDSVCWDTCFRFNHWAQVLIGYKVFLWICERILCDSSWVHRQGVSVQASCGH